ncbi:MAG TPA: cell division topological specificity factor MinE [Epulopiscium sp.]|nr:cell division topological specificity factor MinE [Candidatus Epulonipiscium sp.]
MFDIMKLFGRKEQSGEAAKDRLKLLLIHDRMNCSTELLEMMKADIIAVISKYVDIDNDEFNIEIAAMETDETHKKSPVLSANIPIKSIKKQG